jgi:hypothetical protein
VGGHLLVDHLVKYGHDPLLKLAVVVVGDDHIPDAVHPGLPQALAVQLEAVAHVGKEGVAVRAQRENSDPRTPWDQKMTVFQQCSDQSCDDESAVTHLQDLFGAERTVSPGRSGPDT